MRITESEALSDRTIWLLVGAVFGVCLLSSSLYLNMTKRSQKARRPWWLQGLIKCFPLESGNRGWGKNHLYTTLPL